MLLAVVLGAAISLSMVEELSPSEFARPSAEYRPETWYHLIDRNISRDGITADLEAMKAAGISGFQLFHGGTDTNLWPGVAAGPECLSQEWDELIAFAAKEAKRLGLTFRMQVCPGWSMAGGPWITKETAMRELVVAKRIVKPGETPSEPELPEYPKWRDYRDLATVTFPSPVGEALTPLVEFNPREAITNDCLVWENPEPVTVRSLTVPPGTQFNFNYCYYPGLGLSLEADGRKIGEWIAPMSGWQDGETWTLEIGEVTARRFTLRIQHEHPLAFPSNAHKIAFWGRAQFDNWEALAGRCMRGKVRGEHPRITGDEPRSASVTMLRFGSIIRDKRNGPAPAEATGWECDKLNARGAEAQFHGYIGRIQREVTKGGLDGFLLDSWECASQTWSLGLEKEFARLHPEYDFQHFLPALIGYIVDSRQATETFLLVWRNFLSKCLAHNFYGTMRRLAEANGLRLDFELASGHAAPGDILEYYQYAERPMFEFWSCGQTRFDDPDGFIANVEFNPHRPAVSAANVYGRRRIAAESLTSGTPDWSEDFAQWRPLLDYYFAQGLNHVVFHTMTHHPKPGTPPPGSSFFGYFGAPFVREQTWWPAMPSFTDYIARCEYLLSQGVPVRSVLMLLGDEQDARPSNWLSFPAGYQYDYVNSDALINSLKVKHGKLVTPLGQTYAMIWIRPGLTLLPATAARLDELKRAGVPVFSGEDIGGALQAAKIAFDVPSKLPREVEVIHRHLETAEVYFFCNVATNAVTIEVPRPPNGKWTLERWDAMSGNIWQLEANQLKIGPRSSAFAVWVQQNTLGAKPLPKMAASPTLRLSAENWRSEPEQVPPEYAGKVVYRGNFQLTEEERKRCSYLELPPVFGTVAIVLNGRQLGWVWRSDRPQKLPVGEYLQAGSNELKLDLYTTWHNRVVYDLEHPETATTWVKFYPEYLDHQLKPVGVIGIPSLTD